MTIEILPEGVPEPKQLTKEEHRARHIFLHQALDELVADYINHHKYSLLTKTTMIDFMKWSGEQTREPVEFKG